MGEKDKYFLCPDCFCEVMQTESKYNGEIVYICRRCGLSPLVYCIDCLGLITLDAAEANDCPYCEIEEILFEEIGGGYAGIN